MRAKQPGMLRTLARTTRNRCASAVGGALLLGAHCLAACAGSGSPVPAAPCTAGAATCVDAAGQRASTPRDASTAATATADSGSTGTTARDAATAARDGAAGSDARQNDGGTLPAEPDASSTADAGSCQICAAYAEPRLQAQLQVSELDALSGLASSRKNPGILFAHNDHNRPTIFALDLQGKLHARIGLENAPASDIEDIAVGPCPSGQCVYLADIGDNASTRSEYALLRIAEPSVPSSAGNNPMSVAFERFRFNYEDGSHNAEGFMVAPSGALYVVTKRAEGGSSAVYRLPDTLSASAVNRATKLAELPIPASGGMAASAAAAHPCGLGFLVRTYDRVYEFRIASGAAFETAFKVIPNVVAMPPEPQSEGIDYLADGRGFISSGEGASAPIYQTNCE